MADRSQEIRQSARKVISAPPVDQAQDPLQSAENFRVELRNHIRVMFPALDEAALDEKVEYYEQVARSEISNLA